MVRARKNTTKATARIVKFRFPEISWNTKTDHTVANNPGPEVVRGKVMIIPNSELAIKKQTYQSLSKEKQTCAMPHMAPEMIPEEWVRKRWGNLGG